MTQQKIQSDQISPLRGILLILGIVAGLMLASVVSNLLSQFVPAIYPTLVVWALTALFAFYLMRTRLIEYCYTVSNDVLYVERLYGTRTKILLQMPVLDVVAITSEEKAKKAYPQLGKVIRATLKACELPQKAIVYRVRGTIDWIILQPNQEISALLWDEQKRQNANIEKWGK
ncbi:hypothetical protein LJC33_02375 [Eubacteriales bacterium OttesenSCG-928-N13]|nr:hypothetical protein [Eubacteriales bacterium OttesenSCG-928-N13]